MQLSSRKIKKIIILYNSTSKFFLERISYLYFFREKTHSEKIYISRDGIF